MIITIWITTSITSKFIPVKGHIHPEIKGASCYCSGTSETNARANLRVNSPLHEIIIINPRIPVDQLLIGRAILSISLHIHLPEFPAIASVMT